MRGARFEGGAERVGPTLGFGAQSEEAPSALTIPDP
jgi:hypothetical protein